MIGTLIPGALLIVLGVVWFATGQHSQVPVKADDVIPPFTGLASIVLIVSNFLGYAGMEVNAVHANDMRDPRTVPEGDPGLVASASSRCSSSRPSPSRRSCRAASSA